jgi:hypothetical protein
VKNGQEEAQSVAVAWVIGDNIAQDHMIVGVTDLTEVETVLAAPAGGMVLEARRVALGKPCRAAA